MNTQTFILRVRYALGMTGEQFSELLNCSTRSVYRWESGKAIPNGNIILQIVKLCKERGISI
jgi:DNA-binding transcriptional regulator YiaG